MLDAKSVIDSFARKGIVCSVLKPAKEEMNSLVDTLPKLAVNSDLIIFDWDLHKDKGRTILKLIESIVTNNDAPHQLRLIVIYTGETDIQGVTNKIKRRLAKNKNSQIKEDSSRLLLDALATRIIVFAKPETEVAPEFEPKKISFMELADIVAEEFTNMTQGLVSNVVLESLAQIRKNTHKILNNFSSDLDAPYLTHRILQVDPEDAEDQLCALVVGELHAILHEKKVAKNASFKEIKAWVEDKFSLYSTEAYIPIVLASEIKDILDNNRLQPKQKFSSLSEICQNHLATYDDSQVKNFSEELLELLNQNLRPQAKLDRIKKWFDENRVPPFVYSDGNTVQELTEEQLDGLLEYGIERHFTPRQVEKAHKFTFTNMFLNHQDSHTLDEKFAVITNLRSFYDQDERRLTLGTIVEQDGSYWVCIQPKCDTYRIEKERHFPFLPLSSQDSERNFDVVIKEGSKYLRMSISKKPYDMRLILFEPNEKKIISTIGQKFCDSNGSNFKWVGELRAEQAQRLSNRFATELSRVGVNESQWLRRWASKD